MADQNIKVRHIQKHDTEENWNKAVNFIPKQGEIIIYDVDSNYSYERMKVGDGTTLVSSLPFIDAQKQDKLTFDDVPTVDSTNPVISGGVKTALDSKAEQVELERLHYYGNKDVIPSDESYFTVNSTGETITGLTDAGKTQTELVIPYKINGKEITSIGSQAFVNCTSLTSVNVPNSVTSIGGGAFVYCTSLTSVNVPNSVTSIGNQAFYSCTSLTSVNIPNSVTSIEYNTFGNCTSLTSVNIPNSVTSIRDDVFTGCISLTSVNVPNSVTSIGNVAFGSCTALTSVSIPSSVLSIGNSAFSLCTNLTIYCEQGSYAETYAKENNIPIIYFALKPESDIIETIGLNEAVPNTVLTSVCDYTIKGNTIQAAYGLAVNKVLPNGVCFGKEIPMLTTCGDLKVTDSNDNIKFTYRLKDLIGYRDVYDVFSSKGLYKNWSKKFYLTKLPISSEKSTDYDTTKNITHTWEFTEDEFNDTGIPIKSSSIPFVSACFYSGTDAQAYMNDRVYFAQPYPAIFYYDSDTNKYILKCKGVYDSIEAQLTRYSKVYFYYQLETPYIDNSCMFAMGLNQGDKVTFECDYTQYQFFLDNKIYGAGGYGSTLTDYDFTPIVEISIPQSAKNALQGFDNVSRFLNNGSMNASGDGASDYSWIGKGNETVDYTSTIKNKLLELNNVGGGTLYFGPGIYTISESIIIPSNINIIGNKETIITQKTDNTHALILNGNNILIQDLTIKLLGACTELTACIYANSNNLSGNTSTYNSKYPSNMYVQNINLNNIICIGTYNFKYDSNGYAYIDDNTLNYRGVGIYAPKLYFNFVDCTIRGSHLYATVYGGGGSNKYNIFATECRMALWENCGNSQYDILGHTYYANSSDTETLSLTDYVAYITGECNIINITFYDIQHCKESVIYFDALSMKNRYNISTMRNTQMQTGKHLHVSSSNVMGITDAIDLGRANSIIPNYSDIPFSISNVNTLLSGFTTLKKLDGFYNNVLSGVGIWGNISSNITWTSNGINLEDICRYPKDIDSFNIIPSIISTVSPSEDNPIEITIDFHDHPIIAQDNIWIEFDNRYVGSNVNIYFDHSNDENFTDVTPITIQQNYDKVAYYFNYQLYPSKLYRIKIEFTAALYIENLKYQDYSYNKYEQEYNPNNYIGIVNIGMSSPGLSQNIFLNNTGGKLYGNIDMNNNSITELALPISDNDAATKKYVDKCVDDVNIIHECEGISLSISDKFYTNAIIDYKIYGNSVQDGTPTPDAPIEIQSVGDLVTDTASEHYGKYDVPVRVCGKNLLPNSDWMSGNFSHGFNEDTDVDYITEYTLNSISFNLPAWKSVSSPRFKKDSVKRIVFKINQNQINSDDGYLNFYIIIQGYDDNNNKVDSQAIYGNAVADTEYVFDFSTISIYSFYAKSTQLSFCIASRKNDLSNLMIYDIAYYADRDVTEYEPYVGETTHLYLDEPLRKIGDYADYIDWQNKKIIRNVGETTCNGSESWIATDDTLTGEYQGFAVSNSIYDIPTASNLLCLSDKLPYSSTSDKNVITVANSDTYALRVIIGSDYVPDLTVDSFKTWLVDNNITVVYPINTSIEEIIDIKNYETVDSDVTNIYLLTSVKPSNIYLKYYKSLPTALENIYTRTEIDELLNNKAKKPVVATVAIPTTGWITKQDSNNEDYYELILDVANVTADGQSIIDVAFSDDIVIARTEKVAYQCVDRCVVNDGSVILYCFDELPTTAFTLRIQIIY